MTVFSRFTEKKQSLLILTFCDFDHLRDKLQKNKLSWGQHMKFEKKFFSYLGIFMLIGWITSMIVHKGMYTNQEIFESISFFTVCIIVYFTILHLSYKKKKPEKIIFSILGFIVLISCVGIFFTW